MKTSAYFRVMAASAYIAALGLLSGCSENYRRQCVQDKFPGCELFSFPDLTNRFLVRQPDGTVLVVNCDNPFAGSPTSHSIAFYPPTKK